MIVILGIPQKNIILLTNNAKWWFKLQLKLSLIIVPLTTISLFGGVNYFLATLILGKLIYCSASMTRSCKLLNISISEYLTSFISPIICAIISILLTLALGNVFYFETIILNILLAGLFFIVIYFILIYLFDGGKLTSSALSLFPKNKIILKLAHKQNYKEI